MKLHRYSRLFCLFFIASIGCWSAFSIVLAIDLKPDNKSKTKPATSSPTLSKMERDPKQPIDEEYTKKIKEYTTKPFFNSPLTDYLPASKNVPTPKAVLGDIAGAPGILPYTADVNNYMRLLEKASPRVKVFSIGTSEEGREMIAVAISSESNLSKLDENRARLTKLADPRKINMDDSEAAKIISKTIPIYYITGAIHSPETGAPTALMELAYRLAVDESSYIKEIREHLITLITPVVETDGRDRQVDIYKWHLAHKEENYPPLIYWGHYVAHDNNRDAMGLSLKLTRNVLETYLEWKPQVLHDLHESVPYLYDNTIGDQPYNAWLDPILTNEWQMIGWQNVGEMTKLGMPGVFAHGTFDTWSPSYLMFIAATHNGISRLYETFGNGGADTLERTLSPAETSRTWYRQNPPLSKALWSQRNNNNYEQTGVLISLSFFVERSQQFLNNFYLKSKRSIEKPINEGPAAYVFPADDPRPGGQAELLRLLQRQGCEVHRMTSPFSIALPAKKSAPRTGKDTKSADDEKQKSVKPALEPRQFPVNSYIVRMDQPYSRIADMLLDLQYWSPSDPQIPYDDTAWTFGELGNVDVVRITDKAILRASMQLVTDEIKAPSVVSGSGNIFLVNHNADNTLISLRYRLKNANFLAAEEPFEAAGHKFNRGSFIISDVSTAEFTRAINDLGLSAHSAASVPQIATHAVKAARIAMLHTWFSTQDEGWWRIAFDQLGIPYDYISTQTIARTANLRERYDVIVFAPTGANNPRSIVAGLPMFGNPLPWKKTELTPNLGIIDSTEDMRPGLGWQGVANLQNFVTDGGVLISSMDTSNFAIDYGFTLGVSTSQPQKLHAPGTVVSSKFVDTTSPIAYGFQVDKPLSIFYAAGPIFNISNQTDGRRGRRRRASEDRTSGRGSIDDPDTPQGMPVSEAAEDEPRAETWEAQPLTEEQKRNNYFIIPPSAKPRVVLRFGDSKEILVSGLIAAESELAEHPAVIDASQGSGHIILFSNNPFWRGETQGSYFLVFNAILNFDNLNAGR